MRLESVVTSRTRSPSMTTIALDQILPLPSHNFPNRTALILLSVCAGAFCWPSAESDTSAIPSAIQSTGLSIGASIGAGSRIFMFKYPLIPRRSVPDYAFAEPRTLREEITWWLPGLLRWSGGRNRAEFIVQTMGKRWANDSLTIRLNDKKNLLPRKQHT